MADNFHYFDAVDYGETGLIFLFKTSRREPLMYVDLREAKRLLREMQEAIEVIERRWPDDDEEAA